ncbi:putative lipoprotein [Nitratireductor indicus C115]|uniref:Putative lipoprotein n=1 Tax=Nitratireductor indicus C115 TaxID=1231190 RepID=K2P1S1_9HYPH|nr:putative lipoprotein [Nitratireductor indicus C115]
METAFPPERVGNSGSLADAVAFADEICHLVLSSISRRAVFYEGLSLFNHRVFAGSVVAAAVLLSGCQSEDKLGAFQLGNKNAQETAQSAELPAGAVKESELRAYCPPVALRDGTTFFRTYQKGGQDDPSKVIYQASITDTTRSCQYANGSFSMNVAVAGRVVPGPVGNTGNITMPIRVAVLRGDDVVYSKLFQHNVAIADTAGATQFIFNDPNIMVPGAADRSLQVFVGFDEGPPRNR